MHTQCSRIAWCHRLLDRVKQIASVSEKLLRGVDGTTQFHVCIARFTFFLGGVIQCCFGRGALHTHTAIGNGFDA